MNVQLIYQQNASAERICSYLNKAYSQVKIDYISIAGLNYLLIKIPDPESGIKKSINTFKAVNGCLDKEITADMLKENNISYIGDEEGIIRSYEVLISDLSIVSIRLVYHGRNSGKPKYVRESDHPKLAELAKRIFLILGLDIGVVRLAYTTRRRLRVVGVEPSPVMRNQDLEQFLEKIDEIYLLDKTLPSRNVKLGADPEFMIFNSKTNRMLSASQFFPREGLVGCDNIRIPNRQQRPVAEIRPHPSSCPLKLSNNIKQALDTASRMAPYQNVKWLAGSQPGGAYSIGGHLHFSNTRLNASIIRALDNYVAIPIFLLEEPGPAARRRRKYGFLGDYRLKDYGGFEYRTPASWLVSPQITTAVLCLAKIVASSYYTLSKNFLNSAEAQRAFYEGDQDYFRPIFPELWADIKKTIMYNEYQEELQVLAEMISSQITWNEKVDFRKAWKLKAIPRRRLRSSSEAYSQRFGARNYSPRPPIAARVNSRFYNTGSHSGINRQGGSSGVRIGTASRMSSPASGNNSPGRIITVAQVRRIQVIR